MKLAIFKAEIDDLDEDLGIYAISLVDAPAIMKNFVKLSKEKVQARFSINKMKRIITGPILIPNQLIYRKEVDGYVYFTREEIEKIRNHMMDVDNFQKRVTLQHNSRLGDIKMVECWTKESNYDKSTQLGFPECPVGTLFVSYKVENDKLWNEQIMTGKVKGFSIEGLFNYNKSKFFNQMNKRKKTVPKKEVKVSSFLKAVSAFLSSETETEDLVEVAAADEADSGTPYLIFTLGDGSEVHVDADGLATVNGTAVPAGEYELTDGNFISIDDASMLVVTTEEPEAEEAEEAVELAKQRANQLVAKMSKKSKRETALEKEVRVLRADLEALKKTPKGNPVKQKTNLNSEGDFRSRVGSIIQSRIQAGKGE